MIIITVSLYYCLFGRQAVILMLIQYLSAWRHAETRHSFNFSTCWSPLLCAKHYARSWGPHDEQVKHCSLTSWNVKSRCTNMFAPLTGTGHRPSHPHTSQLRLLPSVSSLGPWAWLYTICLLPTPTPSLQVDSSRRTPPLKTSLSTCHPSLSNFTQNLSMTPRFLLNEIDSFTISQSKQFRKLILSSPSPLLISYLFLCSKVPPVPIQCCPCFTAILHFHLWQSHHPSEVPWPAGCLP